MDYLDSFDTFIPDPTATLEAEFRRLAINQGWQKKSKKFRNERAKFMGEGFKDKYGADETNLQAWQALCEDLGFDDVPETIAQCKKLLQPVHVNLVDLVNARRIGDMSGVKKFRSTNALSDYIRKTGKIYPKEAAKRNALLKFFLIELS